jgi:hypothetical protein
MGSKNRNKILRAIMELGNCYPYEIKNFLDKQARKLIENQYYSNDVFTANKKKDLIRKETISERTIFEWLKKLTKQGLLIHEDNKYRLSNQATSDVEFMSGLFGLNILLSILAHPIDTDSDESLVEAVNCFGVFIVYILLYCLQPLKDVNYSNEKKELEDFRIRWVNNAISPEHMLIILREQLGLLNIISNSNAAHKMKFQELSKVRYEKLIHYLKIKYPNIFNKINEGTDNMNNMIKSKAGRAAR